MSIQDVFSDDWSENHRSGVVAVVGRPNVGKSTLVNAILGQKIAITTPKPQTTRRNQLGIYTAEDIQILFVDTPGLHKARNSLGEYMMTVAENALKDADVILWILDTSEAPQRADQYIAETIQSANNDSVVLALNKQDIAKDTDVAAHLALVPHKSAHRISALKSDGVPELVQAIVQMMPLGPRYYPADQVSDLNMRFIAAEIIREKAMLHTEQEIPHALAVEITDYKDEEKLTKIYAMIYVERESQKGIVVGKKGSMIKRIGTEARIEIAEMIERSVFLDVRVKVLKDWRSNEAFMRRVGYRLPKEKDE